MSDFPASTGCMPEFCADRPGAHRLTCPNRRLGLARVHVRSMVLLIICLAASPAIAQRTGGQPTTGGGFGGGAMAGGTGNSNGQNANQGAGDAFLSPDEAFANGVQRAGAVGQSAAGPVGVSDTSPAAGNALGGSAGPLGGFGGGLGAALGNLFGNQNQGPSAGSAPPIRTRLRSAVRAPVLAPGRVRQNATRRLQTVGSVAGVPGNTATRRDRFRAVDVEVSNRRATLRGTVTSEADRRMSELLLRLEPGVSRVDNQVEVRP